MTINRLQKVSDIKSVQSGITMISDLKTIGNNCLFVKKSLEGPKKLYLSNFETNTIIPVSSEQYIGYNHQEIIVEPYINTSLLTSTFIFNNTKSQPDSPLLFWLTDDKGADSYCPVLHEALKREYIVVKVKIRQQEKVNVKALIDEVQSLGLKIAKDKLASHLYLYAQGNLAGLIGTSAHLRNLGVFYGAVFVDPLTDLLEIWNENKHSNLGYGDLTEEKNTEQMLYDSPYHSDSLHMVQNVLFLASNHYDGYPSLKLYSHMKHFLTPGSHVYWSNLMPKGLPADAVALAYLWQLHCGRVSKRLSN
jgi:hypothetical protein